MDGTEGPSDDFAWRVEALSVTSAIDLHALLGACATVEIEQVSGLCAFDRFVTGALLRGVDETGWRYHLVLRRWLIVPGLRQSIFIYTTKP